MQFSTCNIRDTEKKLLPKMHLVVPHCVVGLIFFFVLFLSCSDEEAGRDDL